MSPDQVRGIQAALDALNSLSNRALGRLTRAVTPQEYADAREEIAQAMRASDALIAVIEADAARKEVA